MTLYQFNGMNEMDQVEAICNHQPVAVRQDKKYFIELYQIDNFYVEAWYYREHKILVRLRSFSNPNLLQPWLQQINIDELLTDKVPVQSKFIWIVNSLANAYRQFFKIKPTVSDRQVWFHFIIMLILLFITGFSIGQLLAVL